MRAALAYSNVVINIIEVASLQAAQQLFPDAIVIDAGATPVNIGWVKNGASWEPAVPPKTPLEQRRAEIASAVTTKTQELFTIGAPVDVDRGTLHVALDDGSRADMTAMATTAIAAASGSLPWPDSYQRGWITVDNTRIPLPTPGAGLMLAAGVGDRYAQIRQQSRDLKDAIAAAATDADLDAIDITAGWPE